MTYREKYQSLKTWQERVLIMNLYHHLMIVRCYKCHNKWNERATAKYFQVSLGLVSENLKLAKRMNDVRECRTRKAALNKIK